MLEAYDRRFVTQLREAYIQWTFEDDIRDTYAEAVILVI